VHNKNCRRFEEDKLFYHEKNVRFSSPKSVETFFPGICYLINLPNGFQNSARKSAHCWIENFTANSEKILLDLAANQLKWQLCCLASRTSFSDTTTLTRKTAVLLKLSKVKRFQVLHFNRQN